MNSGSNQIGFTDPSWKVQAAADLNGDSNADLILRHSVDGRVAIWLLNGWTLQAAAVYEVPDLTWQIQGTGDFNGDGDATFCGAMSLMDEWRSG